MKTLLIAAVSLVAMQGAFAAPQGMDGKARTQLEKALACADISGNFTAADAALKRLGWSEEKALTPVVLSEPLKVHGLEVKKILIQREGDAQTFRSVLPGVSQKDVVKAAALKLGKDRKSYGRVTKLGVLSADVENGETILTCTVESENY